MPHLRSKKGLEMTCQISWTSSEGEPKPNPTKPAKQWRKFRFIDDGDLSQCTPEKRGFQRVKSLEITVQFTPELPLHDPSSLSDSEMSPVMGMMKLSDSPLISESCLSTSPVIGKKRKRPKTRGNKSTKTSAKSSKPAAKSFDCKFQLLQYNPKKFVKIENQCSPDLFSEGEPHIEMKESPCKTQYAISQVSSQDCSIVIDSSTISPQSKAVSLESLYCEIPDVKKKKYKRGGLAAQVQRELKSEKANIDIWKHENYLRKNGAYSPAIIDESLIIPLKIVKLWTEFYTSFAECTNNDLGSFIVLINNDFVDVTKLAINSSYKLLPPYFVQNINFNNRDLKCYVNVTRLKKIS